MQISAICLPYLYVCFFIVIMDDCCSSFQSVQYLFQTQSDLLFHVADVNPLTNLRVVNQTTGSIGISWDLQPNVTSDVFSYSVSYNNSAINTTSKSALLQNLQPGTPYNISVMIVVSQNTFQVTVLAYTSKWQATAHRHHLK